MSTHQKNQQKLESSADEGEESDSNDDQESGILYIKVSVVVVVVQCWFN